MSNRGLGRSARVGKPQRLGIEAEVLGKAGDSPLDRLKAVIEVQNARKGDSRKPADQDKG